MKIIHKHNHHYLLHAMFDWKYLFHKKKENVERMRTFSYHWLMFWILIFVLMMVVEEYLQVDLVYPMPMVVEPNMNDDDDDENFSMYVHHEN